MTPIPQLLKSSPVGERINACVTATYSVRQEQLQSRKYSTKDGRINYNQYTDISYSIVQNKSYPMKKTLTKVIKDIKEQGGFAISCKMGIEEDVKLN